MPRSYLCALLALCISFLPACGGGGSSAPTGPVSGTWTFQANSSVFGVFVGFADLTQTGSDVKGSITFSDNPCFTTADLTGTVSGGNFTVQIQQNGEMLNLTGTFNADFTSVTGNYTSPVNACTAGDHGTWAANRNGS